MQMLTDSCCSVLPSLHSHSLTLLASKDLDGLLRAHDGPSFPSDGVSKLFPWSAGSFLIRAYRSGISHAGAYRIRASESSEHSLRQFDPYWERELRRKNPSLARAILLAFKLDLLLIISQWFVWSGMQYATPLLLPYLSDWFSYSTLPRWWGYVYAACIWSATFMIVVSFNNAVYRSWCLGIRIRAVLINLIFRKALVVTPSSIGSRGVVMNLMASDSQTTLDTLPIFLMGVLSPLQLAVTIGLLSRQIGVYSLVPLAIVLLALPILYRVAMLFPLARHATQRAADVRLKLVTEFVSAIRIVKYYAWERPFLAKIHAARETEIDKLTKIAILNAVMLCLLLGLPSAALGFTIFFYSLGNPIALGSIFAAVAYLSYLRYPFILASVLLTNGTQYLVCLGRIQTFLMAPDLPVKSSRNSEGCASKHPAELCLNDASFTWEFDPAKQSNAALVLQYISLSVRQGEIVAIVGTVGSGKSSLALAMLGETPQVSGDTFVSDPVGYASQEPFIMNNTIRDNIVFGAHYDPIWYQKVVNCCALVRDFELFPAGDLTEVAERGSNLSGGQRQRINVARAMYSNRKLFVLDDPFSAVDAHVGEHMFRNVCEELAHKMNRGVLLITNQLQFLPDTDRIYVLNGGRVIERGSYTELIASRGPFYSMAVEYGIAHEEKLSKSSKSIKASSRSLKSSVESPIASAGEDENLKASELTLEQIEARDAKNREVGKLIQAEGSSTKAVAQAVYTFLFLAGSLLISLLILLLNCVRTAANTGGSVWLSRWANPAHSSQFSAGTYRGLYIGLVCIEVAAICGFVWLIARWTINASRSVHRSLVGFIAHASTSFYDKTPFGRLLARFSKDIDLIDSFLPFNLLQCVNYVFLIVPIIVNLALASKYVVLVLLIAMITYVVLLVLFRRPSIQVQRLEAASRAPIFTHFGETLDGLATIRAFSMTEPFCIASMNKVDYNAVDFLTLRRINHWFNLTTNQIVTLVVGIVYVMLVLFRNYAPSSMNVSLAVSACANSVLLVTIFGQMSLIFFEFEARMNAPERIREYRHIEQEAAYEREDSKPSASWPSEGAIKFQKLSLSYKPGAPVLHKLSASIKAKEKIGIVGRTGAGKSTLITALFRTTEPEHGRVLIDDIDIASLGLYDLRRRLSIIPQVPQLFMGTLRYNLDPFEEHSDERLWQVIEMVGLNPFISSLAQGLTSIVEENGSNFSIGQRQLVSMARCLLLDSNILLLDEATASLDVQSDSLLQKMIRTHFADRTVLTIAHRLVTIIDYDRVMVLDAGRIAEFDTPRNLLQIPNGIFYGMVQATGKSTARHLTEAANGALKVSELIELDPDILEESSI